MPPATLATNHQPHSTCSRTTTTSTSGSSANRENARVFFPTLAFCAGLARCGAVRCVLAALAPSALLLHHHHHRPLLLLLHRHFPTRLLAASPSASSPLATRPPTPRILPCFKAESFVFPRSPSCELADPVLASVARHLSALSPCPSRFHHCSNPASPSDRRHDSYPSSSPCRLQSSLSSCQHTIFHDPAHRSSFLPRPRSTLPHPAFLLPSPRLPRLHQPTRPALSR